MKFSKMAARVVTSIVVFALLACLVTGPFVERSAATMGFVIAALLVSMALASWLVLGGAGRTRASCATVCAMAASGAATVLALLGLSFAVMVDSDSETGWRTLVMFAFASSVLLASLAAYSGAKKEQLDPAMVAMVSGTIAMLAVFSAPMIAAYNWWVGLWAGLVAAGLFVSALLLPLTRLADRRARAA